MVYLESGSPCMDTCSHLEVSNLCEEHHMDGCFCPEGMCCGGRRGAALESGDGVQVEGMPVLKAPPGQAQWWLRGVSGEGTPSWSSPYQDRPPA